MTRGSQHLWQRVAPDQRQRWSRFEESHSPRELQVSGVEWSYLSAGDGPPLMLLPGGARFAEVWFQAMVSFSRKHRVLVPTYPVLSQVGPYLDGLAGILEQEGIERVNLLGTSFGGCLAQCFVRSRGSSVERLILSSTMAPESLSAVLLDLRAALVRLYPAGLVGWLAALENLWLLAPPAEERAFWWAFWRQKLGASDTKEAVVAAARSLADYARHYHFTPGDLQSWDGEVLLLESDNDRVVRPRMRTELRTLYPRARLHTFRGIGHTPGYTHPEEFVQVVEEFLETTECR